jgi:SAM-dependent methyltransferase
MHTPQAELFPELKPLQGFHYQGPYEIGPASLANLLVFVRSAARRPLTAHDLATVFGPERATAQLVVSELYAAAVRGQRRSTFPRVATFYAEWNRIFGAVYGEQLSQMEAAAQSTAHLYNLPAGVTFKPLLFAIHTYYALLMKLIAIELLALQDGFSVKSFVHGLGAEDDARVRERLVYLESGGDFAHLGVENFLEADFFSWYLDAWSERLPEAVRGVIRGLAEFEPATPILEPDWTRDLLQKLYELIVPKDLRHALGEYYTPDWLAGYLIDTCGYDGQPQTRFLDPACGSGTFLVQAIQRVSRQLETHERVAIADVGRAMLTNIVGFDLNPLAVLAARTNYLIAFARFLPYVRPVSLPVYLCDSVVPPDQYEQEKQQGNFLTDNVVTFRTTEHDYVFPVAMKDKARIDIFTSSVLLGLRAKFAPAQFRMHLAQHLPLAEQDTDLLLAIYQRIKQLDDEKRDGIWAHYIKNAFAPVYTSPFDFVVGNPPWIRWGYLSAEYRALTLKLWQAYGLFSLKGHQTRLGAGEKDFSMLFTYACADRYLKDGGTLAFVITHEVFKAKGAGEGFRRFQIGEKGAALCVTRMEDMVDLKPFHAANKTCIFTMKKGAATKYPVPVLEWRRKPGVGRVLHEWPIAEVESKTLRQHLQAMPINKKKPVSSWQTATRKALKAGAKLKGANHYGAYLGARVEPYGVFWLRLMEVRPDGQIVVENMCERGKREIKSIRNSIENDLVYPAVSGGNITRFGIKTHFYVLMCQDPEKREPYSQEWMTEHVPWTLGYLRQFESVLRSRGSRTVRDLANRTEFYAMFGIGTYTFAPYRVAWKRMANHMAATVLAEIETPYGCKTVIGTDTTSFYACDDEAEAHYLCAIMNAPPVNDFVRSFSAGGRGFGAPSMAANIAIPKFDPGCKVHQQLAALSQTAHQRVALGQALDDVDRNLTIAVKELWNIAP